ncbi:hypothetical protein [Microbacterium trichothecenolyticum]|uniref:DUF600 family protein n=1 Tax=Microbacterium trichothecenolyticum TaxID=69370 RepID=A0ABU0TTX5_MICTR|nr:hypothetical protein [Microbacterium trichothecenolyticum]MDQ1123114.1 hypothetical protein [Microbacterium trichothecenolyticum]
MTTTASAEQAILHDLISKWISLGVEYISGTEGVEAIYIYAANEVPGATYVGIAFEKDGEIDYPARARGGGAQATNLSGQMIELLLEDLGEARRKFENIGVPSPTEYRVFYEIATRRLEVRLSRETIYRGSNKAPSVDGFTMWLGDRAPKL